MLPVNLKASSDSWMFAPISIPSNCSICYLHKDGKSPDHECQSHIGNLSDGDKHRNTVNLSSSDSTYDIKTGSVPHDQLYRFESQTSEEFNHCLLRHPERPSSNIPISDSIKTSHNPTLDLFRSREEETLTENHQSNYRTSIVSKSLQEQESRDSPPIKVNQVVSQGQISVSVKTGIKSESPAELIESSIDAPEGFPNHNSHEKLPEAVGEPIRQSYSEVRQSHSTKSVPQETDIQRTEMRSRSVNKLPFDSQQVSSANIEPALDLLRCYEEHSAPSVSETLWQNLRNTAAPKPFDRGGLLPQSIMSSRGVSTVSKARLSIASAFHEPLDEILEKQNHVRDIYIDKTSIPASIYSVELPSDCRRLQGLSQTEIENLRRESKLRLIC